MSAQPLSWCASPAYPAGMTADPPFSAVSRAVSRAHYDPTSRPQHVVPLVRTFELGSICELVLISLEAWTTWFDLSYALFGAEGAQGLDLERTHLTPWEARDEMGTRYEGIGAAGGGEANRWSGHIWFQPALQPSAARLELNVPAPDASGKRIQLRLDLPV